MKKDVIRTPLFPSDERPYKFSVAVRLEGAPEAKMLRSLRLLWQPFQRMPVRELATILCHQDNVLLSEEVGPDELRELIVKARRLGLALQISPEPPEEL